jgi:predicted amidohydrolase
MKIGYLQSEIVFGDKERNFEAIHAQIRGVHADLLVLPELFATGYTFTSPEEVKETAETTNGPTAGFLKELSKYTGATMVGGFVETDGSNVYNALLIVSGDEVIDTYRKIHLFNKEKFWFTPGNKPYKVYDIHGIKIGVMICFDWIFPEACRTLALKDMQVLAHPANLIMPYCQNAMVTRCLENSIFAVTANRIGTEQRGEDRFIFTGASQITGHDGKILSLAPPDKPHVSVVDIDEKLADHKKINPYNDVLKDRRTEFYEIG